WPAVSFVTIPLFCLLDIFRYMVFLERSLLTGVEASAAQNLPVTKTCLQCGAVLPSSVRACNFCDSAFSVGPSSWNDSLVISAAGAERPGRIADDFSFTIAIGRPSKTGVCEESRMVIDVSVPPDSETSPRTQLIAEHRKSQPGLHPLASIDDRRLAALIDLGC